MRDPDPYCVLWTYSDFPPSLTLVDTLEDAYDLAIVSTVEALDDYFWNNDRGEPDFPNDEWFLNNYATLVNDEASVIDRFEAARELRITYHGSDVQIEFAYDARKEAA